MICSECKGERGWFPIIDEGHNRLGYVYPIEGPWQCCQVCKGTGHLKGSEEEASEPFSVGVPCQNGEPEDNQT